MKLSQELRFEATKDEEYERFISDLQQSRSARHQWPSRADI